MACNAGPKIVNDGLVLAVDAGNTKSYPPPITYVGGTSDSDSSSSFTLSGLRPGDLVLYFGAEDDASLNTPTGESWTAIPGLPTQPQNNAAPNSAAFYVFASGTSVTASGLAGGNKYVHVMIAFRNVDSTNPFDVNAIQTGSAGFRPNPPLITPVTNNSMIVAVGLQDDEDIANTISPPTGYTTALNMDSQGGANNAGAIDGATIMTAYKLLATAAAEDPGAFTSSNEFASDSNKGISIALRPKYEVTFSTWNDMVGSGIGTLTNEPTFDSGNGGSIVFDGTDDYVDVGSTNIPAGPLTVSAWINLSSEVSIATIASSNGDWIFSTTSRRPSAYNFASAAETTAPSGQALSIGVWYNVVMVQGSSLDIYINGSLSATNPDGTDMTATEDLDIGRRPGTNNRYHHGKIADLKIYSKALTASEIKQNYDAHRGRYGI